MNAVSATTGRLGCRACAGAGEIMGTAADAWISWELWGAIAAALLWAVGLVVAFRRRWFARLRGGFTAALTVALVGSGVITTVLLGMWTYQEARRAVFGQLLEGLANVDRVAEGELLADVRLNVQKMSNVADPTLLTRAAKDPESVRAALAELQRYNHRLLQISLYDGDGKAVVVSTPKGNPEPPNRVGAAYAVDGRPFVSDPYVSTAFNRQVLYISVPILAADRGNAIGGAGTSVRPARQGRRAVQFRPLREFGFRRIAGPRRQGRRPP